MKADLYTKAMLTVIAATLAWTVLRDLAVVSAAQGEAVQKVMIVDWAREVRPIHAVLVHETGLPIANADGLRVVVVNRAAQPVPVAAPQPLPVGIFTVQRGRDASGKPTMPWEPLQVEVARSANSRTPGE